jgi:hypothetical protein
MKKEFHHVGIPTTNPQPNETYLADAKLYVTDANKAQNRIEMLRFEPGSPLPDILKTTAHVAYLVDDLDAALAGQKVILPPFVPMKGVRVAFIQDGEVPVEFLQITE